LRIAAVLG
jgi:hypothetical protein